MKPIKKPRRISDLPEIGDMSLLPNIKLNWLAGGFIVFCCSCGCRLTPVPTAQDPRECCDCDREQRYLPASMVDNRADAKRGPSRYLLWDAEIDNAVMDPSETPTFFAGLEEARTTAKLLNGKRGSKRSKAAVQDEAF